MWLKGTREHGATTTPHLHCRRSHLHRFFGVVLFLPLWVKTSYVCTNCGDEQVTWGFIGRGGKPPDGPCLHGLPFNHVWRYAWSSEYNSFGMCWMHGDGFLSIHRPTTVAFGMQGMSESDREWFVRRYNEFLDNTSDPRHQERGALFDQTVARLRFAEDEGGAEWMFTTAGELLKNRDRAFLSEWLCGKSEPRRLVALQLLREARIVPVGVNSQCDDQVTDAQMNEIVAYFGMQK